MGFLNDFINSSGIIFEFHYNFIIFFLRLGSTILYKKFQFLFTPYTPQKNDYFGKIWPFWHFLVLFGFFLTTYTPPKKQKKHYIGTILPFCHFLALLGYFFPPHTPKKPKKW